MSPHLQFGYVSRVHGLKGELIVRTFDPASEVLFEVDRIWVKRRDGIEEEVAIEEANDAPKGEVRVVFDGVTSREQAAHYVGATLFAFREDLEQPEGDEFFQGDLIGIVAYDLNGEKVGTVEEVWNHGEVPNLVIREAGKEIVLPMQETFVKSVDLAARKIVVEMPEYV
ncbi:MAG: ribosome maturation factor RimM [Myxococcaceae bacterium]